MIDNRILPHLPQLKEAYPTGVGTCYPITFDGTCYVATIRTPRPVAGPSNFAVTSPFAEKANKSFLIKEFFARLFPGV